MNVERKFKFVIVGAGIGGLAAGAALKERGENDFVIIDPSPQLPANLHNGLHYLHSVDWPRPFPFAFRQIVATEQIWNPKTDEFSQEAKLPDAFAYSLKVMGLRHPSSIMDVGRRQWTTNLPESNDMNDLLRAYEKYIGSEHFWFGCKVERVNPHDRLLSVSCITQPESVVEYEHLISTAPLNEWFKTCQLETEHELVYKPVHVTNYKNLKIVPNWLVGLYISDPEFPPYRITALGDVLSLESLRALTVEDEHLVRYHLGKHFSYDLDSVTRYEWKTGRIWGLSPSQRDAVAKRFKQYGISLLGRFGRWDGKLVMDTTIVQAQQTVNEIIS